MMQIRVVKDGERLGSCIWVRVLVIAVLAGRTIGLAATTLFVAQLLQSSRWWTLVVLLGLTCLSRLLVRLGGSLETRLVVLLGLTLLRMLVVCLILRCRRTLIRLLLGSLLSILVSCLLLSRWVILNWCPGARLSSVRVRLVVPRLVTAVSRRLVFRLLGGSDSLCSVIYLMICDRLC